jgi:GNAT superfamily N-acetyltransferase
MTTHPDVVPAGAADLDTLSHLIADAFHPLAPCQWLIADPAARRQVFPGYFRLYVEHAMADGIIHTTSDRAAAALWLPAGPDAPAQPADYGVRLAAAISPWTERFVAFDAALEARHPAGIHHRHLAILAVRPGRQGQGSGTALLRACHQALDRDGTPGLGGVVHDHVLHGLSPCSVTVGRDVEATAPRFDSSRQM